MRRSLKQVFEMGQRYSLAVGFFVLLILVQPFMVFAQLSSSDSKPVPNAKGAKSKSDVSDVEVQFWAPRKLKLRFGIEFSAGENYCTKLHATMPFPTDWPEQKVTIVSADIPSSAKYTQRSIPGGAHQLVIDAPQVNPNTELKAIVVVEVEKSFIKAPTNPSSLTIPKPIPKDLQWYMGDSPYIDPDHTEVKKVAREIKAKEPENAWIQVEMIFDWVRDHIAYKNGAIRSTQEAMKDKSGDCEELTGIFVAICRASGIPARCVWIPEHCYPEFYLNDVNGDGHWYPCQIAGERQFGEINEYRPILQKGDRFKVPEKKGMQRYVSEYLKCDQKVLGPTKPKVNTIRDLGELQAEVDQLQARRRSSGRIEIDVDSAK